MDQRSNLNFVGAKITGLPNSTATGEAVTHDQLASAIEGLSWKDSVRVASTANINLAAPGASIDGITMVANDRFLAKDQTTGSQNGIYIWNGAATPATRAVDMSTAAEVEQAVTTVEEGTSAGSTFRQTAVNVTLDTTTLAFVAFGTSAPAASETTPGIIEIATQAETDTGTDDVRALTPLKLSTWSGRKRKATGTIGDGSATSYQINHNFNTRDVTVEVYRNSGNYDTVLVDVQRTSVNQVTLVFATAPTAAQFAYVILA
jgi:hypothetical protein